MISILTDRETEICTLFGKGIGINGISRELGISPYTVNSYIGSSYGKVKKLLTDKKVLKTRTGELHPRVVVLCRYAWELEKPEVIFRDDNTLTVRQKDIASLLASGYSVKRIARTLDITTNTAEVHLHRAIKALKDYLSQNGNGIKVDPQTRRNYLLVRYAFDRGLAKPIFKT